MDATVALFHAYTCRTVGLFRIGRAAKLLILAAMLITPQSRPPSDSYRENLNWIRFRPPQEQGKLLKPWLAC
jgi:hypothetical protein